jgi:hypothetical protein
METPEPEMKRKKMHKDSFEPYAPPSDLTFPPNARLTAYELLAFFPNSIRSPAIIYRFASNGASRRAIWSVVNEARDLQKEWTGNQCGTAITKTMNRAGYLNWTMTGHEHWHATRKDLWDESNLGVIDFAAPGEQHTESQLGKSLLFKDLAISIRRWPHGNEALDLTRMVGYCIQNPGERWMYPQDYDRLLSVLGGPALIGPRHLDREIFKQWAGVKPSPHRIWSVEEQETARKLLEEKKTKTNAGNTTLETTGLEKHTTGSTPTAIEQRRSRGRPRTSVKTKEGDDIYFERYTHASAKYVAPLVEATAPNNMAILRAFMAELDAGETDVFSAYAFGGPRHQPPYRMLHDIEHPDSADISGWAENLRWAFEQRACFSHTAQIEGWNESPAHMRNIAEIRQKQKWASDELLEQLQCDEDEE